VHSTSRVSWDIDMADILLGSNGATSLGVLTVHSILILFVFNVGLLYQCYKSYTFELDQCFASMYRFSASLKLITFQMALR